MIGQTARHPRIDWGMIFFVAHAAGQPFAAGETRSGFEQLCHRRQFSSAIRPLQKKTTEDRVRFVMLTNQRPQPTRDGSGQRQLAGRCHNHDVGLRRDFGRLARIMWIGQMLEMGPHGAHVQVGSEGSTQLITQNRGGGQHHLGIIKHLHLQIPRCSAQRSRVAGITDRAHGAITVQQIKNRYPETRHESTEVVRRNLPLQSQAWIGGFPALRLASRHSHFDNK